ncbi:MAG: reverse transcriptase domain-containing protein [Desulfoprunum sp.]
MGLSAHDAVYQVRDYIRKGYRVADDADLAKFFDTVKHDFLMCRGSKKVRDKRVLKLIGKYLRTGVMVNGRREESRRGVPHGDPLSPLLSNILLDDILTRSWRAATRNHRFARYADDFVILVKSPSITLFLEQKLKLKFNQEKSKVAHTNEITFLGFAFNGVSIRWSDKAFAKFKQRLKELTGRSWGVFMEFRFTKLAEYLRGWMGYFGISEYYAPIPEIDHWLRRRVRMCYWKQWRYCRTKVLELTKLGTFLRTAISAGMSRKGPWRLSHTLATQSGMTNQWLKCQGLLSVKDLWVNIHYTATAR